MNIECKKSKKLYEKFSRVLDKSIHGKNMEVKIQMLIKDDEAFNHSLLKSKLNDLKKNAKKYNAKKQFF